MTARDPEELAVERGYPGLACDFARVYEDSFEIRVLGTPECLIEHGIIVQKMVDLLPACGKRHYGNFSMKKHGLPYWAGVRRVTEGHVFGAPRLQVRRQWGPEEGAAELCKRLAIEYPRLSAPAQAAKEREARATPVEWKANEMHMIDYGLRVFDYHLTLPDARFRLAVEDAVHVSAVVARFRAEIAAAMQKARVMDSQQAARPTLRLVKT